MARLLDLYFTNMVVKYKSNNLAKKASWKFQMDEDRGLGLGTVKVDRS